MKTCKSCGYKNEDAGLRCGICGGDISGLAADAAPVPRSRKVGVLIFLAVMLIYCATLYYYVSRFQERQTLKNNIAAAQKPFSNEGVIYTLEKMRALKFLGAEETAAALAALADPDEKVRAAGAKTAGAWLRAGIPGLSPLSERLLSALDDRSAQVRKEAAMEIGLLIGLGLMKPDQAPGLEKKVLVFMSDKSDIVRSAGYFLAAMAGMSGLKGRLEYAFSHEQAPMTRLYAACALAGFGSEEGSRAVFGAAQDPDANTRKEAVLCLAYAAGPQAVPRLVRISRADPDFEVADYAKFSLNLRKQLAIINNKPE